MHSPYLALPLALAMMAPAAAQSPAAQATAAPQAVHYSVSATPVGTLLDDPAAAAILKRLIPTVYANDMFQTMGRTQTLKAIQQYEPEVLSDQNLTLIQAEFDKLPPAH
mgnify:CR=1 FL=1